MFILFSIGMKLFLAMLTATGMTAHAGCYKAMDVTPNVCYVVRAYRSDYTWKTIDFYRVTENEYIHFSRRTR